MQTKKAFVPLPILEQAQNKLPWHIAFSQKLGRHAVARRDIQAGERVLAEEAVIAVPAPLHQDSTCHTCLGALPPNTEHQHADQPIVDVTSGGYKRYCSQQCHDNDTYAAVTAPVHAVIPQLAENTACDPTLLHVMLELDARCQQAVTNAKESTTEATADSNAQALSNLTLANPSQKAAASSSKAASDGDHNATAATSASHINREASAAAAATSSDQSGPAAPPASTEEGYSATTAAAAATANGHQTDSAAHQHEDSALVVHSAIEDVQALLGPWDRNEHSWREAIAAGQQPFAIYLNLCIEARIICKGSRLLCCV